MPELPDVAYFKTYLDATALHQTIRRTIVHDPDTLKGVSARGLQKKLVDHCFESTDRWGKFLFVKLDQGPWLVMHFEMIGHLDVESGKAYRPLREIGMANA